MVLRSSLAAGTHGDGSIRSQSQTLMDLLEGVEVAGCCKPGRHLGAATWNCRSAKPSQAGSLCRGEPLRLTCMFRHAAQYIYYPEILEVFWAWPRSCSRRRPSSGRNGPRAGADGAPCKTLWVGSTGRAQLTSGSLLAGNYTHLKCKLPQPPLIRASSGQFASCATVPPVGTFQDATEQKTSSDSIILTRSVFPLCLFLFFLPSLQGVPKCR